MKIPSASTDRKMSFVAVDATDLKTRETALSSFTVYRSRDGGTPVVYTTPTIAEASASNMPGVYWLTLDEDTTIGAGHDFEEYVVHITHAGMAPVTRSIEIERVKFTEGQLATMGSSRVDANVAAMAANVVTAAAIATDAIDADAIAANAIDASALAADAVTEIATAIAAPSAAVIADAVWDEARSGHVALGTFGERMMPLESGTAAAGAAGTITLGAGASSTTGFYHGATIQITGGTGAGQNRLILSYNGGTKVATIDTNWATTPDATSTYIIDPIGRVDLRSIMGSSVNNTSAQIGCNVVTAGTVSWTAGAITSSVLANQAIGASELAADAVTEIVDAVWANVTRTLTSLDEDTTTIDLDATIQAANDARFDAIDTAIGGISGGGGPTAASIADAVWDELLVDHVIAGSAGEALADAGLGGAPDPDIAAIKAKTDNLPTDPADASVIAASFAAQDAEIAAVKAKTDQLSFGVSNQVNANVNYVNEVQITGTGVPGDTWGPV